MSKKLTPKQSMFVKHLSKGHTKKDSAILAGYSENNASLQASRLMKDSKITKALDKVGLTDAALASGLKTTIESGLGVKSTNSDAIRGIDLATKLKGYQAQSAPSNASTPELHQTNIYINELKNMDDNELSDKIDKLTKDIGTLKAK
jgi:hypothetical protein